MSDASGKEPDIIEHLSTGRALRLIKTPEPKRPEPPLAVKAMFDDMRRRESEDRGRPRRDSGGKDAA
jgi:hypothetical protein